MNVAITEKKKRLLPGQARVEFLAVRDEVEDLLDEGHTLCGAYEILFKQGKITSSYQGFYKNYSGQVLPRAKNKRTKKVIPAVDSSKPAQAVPAPVTATPTKPQPTGNPGNQSIPANRVSPGSGPVKAKVDTATVRSLSEVPEEEKRQAF